MTAILSDSEALDELAAWWQEATGGDPDREVNGGDLVDVVGSLLERVRPQRRPPRGSPAMTAADAPAGLGWQTLPRVRLQRIPGRQHPREEPLTSAIEVFDLFRNDALTWDRERFFAILLDGRNRVIALDTVSVGSLTAALVHPRELFKAAVLSNSAAMILVHNHPSGDPSPSAEDDALTRRLVQAGELIGIKVLDHIVLGDQRYRSFSEDGKL